MQDKILSIISTVTQVETEVLKKNLTTEGLWGSFLHIELVVNLEAEFYITFEQEEIASMKTPQAIIDTVTKKTNK